MKAHDQCLLSENEPEPQTRAPYYKVKGTAPAMRRVNEEDYSLRASPFLSLELAFSLSPLQHRSDSWAPPGGPNLRPTICLSTYYVQGPPWAPEWNEGDLEE